ncbi:MAG: helix-turn-helix domain-containing protein, partial [Monoglobales bacterium]
MDRINKEQVGKRIAELRKKHNITQIELARRLGITNRAVSKWESGISAPSMETLYKICKCFSVSTDFFIMDKPNEKDDKVVTGMQSLKELYRIGFGPSSSHTMGPERICREYKKLYEDADEFKVILYGSLAHTGIGHGTNTVVKRVLGKVQVEFDGMTTDLPHPNTMKLIAYQKG